MPEEDGRNVGLYTQTHGAMLVTIKIPRPQPIVGQVHLVETDDSLSPRRGRLLMKD